MFKFAVFTEDLRLHYVFMFFLFKLFVYNSQCSPRLFPHCHFTLEHYTPHVSRTTFYWAKFYEHRCHFSIKHQPGESLIAFRRMFKKLTLICLQLCEHSRHAYLGYFLDFFLYKKFWWRIIHDWWVLNEVLSERVWFIPWESIPKFTTISCPRMMRFSFKGRKSSSNSPLEWRQETRLMEIFFLFISARVAVLTMYSATFLAWIAGLKASVILHKHLLANVLKCTMDYFDVTPKGRILVRFSHDIDILDNRLITCIRQFLNTIFRVRFYILHLVVQLQIKFLLAYLVNFSFFDCF